MFLSHHYPLRYKITLTRKLSHRKQQIISTRGIHDVSLQSLGAEHAIFDFDLQTFTNFERLQGLMISL